MLTILVTTLAGVGLLSCWTCVGFAWVAIGCGDGGICALPRWKLALGGPLVWLVWVVERRRP